MELANKADLLVAHNVDFDFNVVGIELLRSGIDHQTWVSKPRDSWDNLLKDYPRYMRNSMYKCFEKVEKNVKSRRSQIRKVLKQRKGYKDFVI